MLFSYSLDFFFIGVRGERISWFHGMGLIDWKRTHLSWRARIFIEVSIWILIILGVRMTLQLPKWCCRPAWPNPQTHLLSRAANPTWLCELPSNHSDPYVKLVLHLCFLCESMQIQTTGSRFQKKLMKPACFKSSYSQHLSSCN